MKEGVFKKAEIGIIGARGRMGCWFRDFFSIRGYAVEAIDPRGGDKALERASRVDLLLLSVPVPVFEEVMASVGPHTREDGVVVDITSLKTAPVKSMLTHARGEVIGTHPFFGPSVPSMQNQVVFACPARGRRWWPWLREIFTAGGARLVELDPERHDQLMALVQSLRHLVLAAWGRTLMRLGFDPSLDLELAGPWSQALAGLLAHQVEQPGSLYAELAMNNPWGRNMARSLKETVEEFQQTLESGDQDALSALLDVPAAAVSTKKTSISS